MFNKTTPVIESTDTDVVVPADAPIPLSVLSLDVDPPTTGWEPFLTVRNIAVVIDDIGRKAVSRDDARRLITEKHENERRAQEVAKQNEQRLIEADRVRRASIWGGIPADHLPVGVSAASAMFAADRDARPRRLTPLQEALSSDTLTYHPIRSTPDES
jgi:hypothetical protein